MSKKVQNMMANVLLVNFYLSIGNKYLLNSYKQFKNVEVCIMLRHFSFVYSHSIFKKFIIGCYPMINNT